MALPIYLMNYRPLVFALTLALFIGCRQKEKYGALISENPVHIKKGQALFESQCSTCHFMGQQSIGPDLSGLTGIVESNWIKEFIQHPSQKINEKDERATALFEEYQLYMPDFPALSDTDLDLILSYLHTFERVPGVDRETRTVLSDPIKNTVGDSGIVAELELILQAPATQKKARLARINKLDCEPGSGRLFINDLRGILYEIEDGNIRNYLSVREHKKQFIDQPGLGTGFGSFAFHPDFVENGLLYTTHSEPPSTKQADFTYEESIKVTLQGVVTEWRFDTPTSKTFSGTNRELLRIDFVRGLHGLQEIAFNPTVAKDDPDYGKLYIGLGDGGSTLHGAPHISNHNGSRIWSSILRIDPTGNTATNGQYGIPEDNPFVHTENKLGELWAYGFRNPNRITWDDKGRLIATDIGETQIEEINIIEPGKNYGWPIREGTFELDPNGDLSKIYPLTTDDPSLDLDLSYTTT